MSALVAIFAFCFAGCLYIYFGYPALLFVLSRLRPNPHRPAVIHPDCSVVIPIFNEAEIIEEKIRNTLALDYPAERLEILVVSDGSTDRSEEIVRRYHDRGVRLEVCPRRGKAFALNRGAELARGEILVLTDANSFLEPDCLRRLVEGFADREVGGVCGNKKYRRPGAADSTDEGENLYWRYDKWQKSLESRLGSIFAADGALYAIRRHLYVPVVDPAQADDIAISARVVLQGYRLVYARDAVAFEDAPRDGREELRRKIRVTNHSVLALLKLGRPLWTSGFYSVELLSHKLFRHLVPFLLLPLLLSNLALAFVSPLFLLLFALHLLFYVLAVAGFLARGTRFGRLRLLSIPYYFTLVNLAAFLGVLSILGGRRLPAWNPRSGIGLKGDSR